MVGGEGAFLLGLVIESKMKRLGWREQRLNGLGVERKKAGENDEPLSRELS
jgi:hypothetical protein